MSRAIRGGALQALAAEREGGRNLRCVSLTIEEGDLPVEEVGVGLTGSHCELDNGVIWCFIWHGFREGASCND